MKWLMILTLLNPYYVQSSVEWAESAWRDPEVDYEVYMNGAREIREIAEGRKSALGSARSYNQEELQDVVRWKSSELQERFEEMRDKRIIEKKGHDNFPRRLSWLFPDDGCFARAALANRILFEAFYPVPQKVFVFGNLKVKTSNSPRGFVSWWYHVAPIVQVLDKKFVLDPAIEPDRPLELEEWLERQGNVKKMKVAICQSGTYSPRDNCEKETDGLEQRAFRTQLHYLEKERIRLHRLGRPVNEELGDRPPWL